ncbi:aspartate kinase [Psychroserpens sp.]|uniref:aspartate kinase n=1 Tax=Psychroserpens sp. TaxID=2020870 RepID=UPI001B1DABF0|nr:aspartate kinase [Psychroserpens sp.]MBO6607715.1 aspartate kinase [Psychroserpens sp.]MBO6654706.1 aspartate kinase [Psychroserpens sp.]MBO6682870.1 aspartate kinase [Psychroserpens sp.]MBO6751073.1 aspartate kinase [Psychroserpens sp.]MBO6916358.1 aspartate kinase [Psychroserpens sp.]
MRIFKFGGASVKNADGVKNMASVLRTVGYENTLVVVSAMGKTTNALEVVIKNYFENRSELQSSIQDVKKFHNEILLDLFENTQHPIFKKVSGIFEDLDYFLGRNKSPDYNFVYDQVIGNGELVSTTIISAYLNEIGIVNNWLDVREFIKTDNYYRRANVDWDRTQTNIQSNFDTKLLNITQGFLGSDPNNFTTTLGREGSDYTAAIFAYCLNASSVTIWKDVPGVLNADPRYFENAKLLNKISYREAIELAFYGASVIHPKTLQPLQRKEIPLYVKSFLNPKDEGTMVGKGVGIEPEIPCYIVKKNQVLIRLSSLDFSYIVEDNISYIFKLLHEYKMKVDVIQNSAISFSVCFDNTYNNLETLLQQLKARFKVTCYENVSLYTVRHYNESAIASVEKGKELLLKQLTQETIQMVTK